MAEMGATRAKGQKGQFVSQFCFTISVYTEPHCFSFGHHDIIYDVDTLYLWLIYEDIVGRYFLLVLEENITGVFSLDMTPLKCLNIKKNMFNHLSLISFKYEYYLFVYKIFS